MHSASVLPRIFIDCGVAQSLFSRWVRFGPTVPVVPAAASVWQLPQPPEPVKMALPAAGLVADELELERRAGGAGRGAGSTTSSADARDAGRAALGGGVPTGGGAFGFWWLSQVWKAAGRDHVDGAAHQRVAGAAQLGALGRVGPDPVRGDPQRGHDAGHRVELLGELGHEEAVDDVQRAQIEHHRLALGQVEHRRDDLLAAGGG